MKIRVSGALNEVSDCQKQKILDMVGFSNGIKATHPDWLGKSISPKGMVISPEFLHDTIMYQRRMDTPLTPEAEEWEIESWKTMEKEIDCFLANYVNNRKKLQFVSYDWSKDRDVPTKDPQDEQKERYEENLGEWYR